MTSADKYLMRIILLSAKKTLTRKWLQADTPGIQELYNTVYQIFVMERLTMSLRLQRDKFNKYWLKWTQYIQQFRRDFV